ncbi:MAG: hypothetical protein HYY84_01445 [Deltaproteobacteria bacterium]|nr:hypothetical protein [Deltaproteobacteria bacterium]
MPKKRDDGRALHIQVQSYAKDRAIYCAGDDDIDEARLGGKAASLARLTAAGFAVPRWFAVTTDVFAAALEPLRREIDEALAACSLDDAASLARAAAAVAAMVRNVPFAHEDELALAAAVATFGSSAVLAVRSSAVGEDGATASFAGQMETYLYVRPHEVVERVRDSWASAFGERVLAYRMATGARRLAFGDVRAAVVVQEMIESEASGVLFTRNPQSGAAEHVVNAAWGLGEGVVADRVVADTYFVDRGTGVIRRQVSRKDARVVFDRAEGSGTTVEALPRELCEIAVLDDAALRELAALGERVEARAAGAPQDIEWAVAGGRVYLLQARPITAMSGDGRDATRVGEKRERGGRRLDPVTVFDNSNIVESFPGVTTPLTFSFARRLYAQVFRRTFEGVVVPGATPEALARIWPNMLGYIDGRIYYNLTTWYRMNALLPHFEKSREAWEKMLGITEGLPLETSPATSLGERLRRPFEMAAFYATLAWRLARLKADVERALAQFRAIHAEAAAADYDAMSASDLAERFRTFERDAMRFAHQTNVNDFFVSRAYDALARLVKRFRLDPEGEHLENDLLCGEKGMDSVEPVRSVLQLAAMSRVNAELRALFESQRAPDAVLSAVRAEARFSEFRAAVDEHLAAYGDRGIEELKLEVPSVRDDPAFLVSVIRNYIGTDVSVEVLEARERGIRDAAEAKVRARLGRDPTKRALFDFVLEKTRQSVRFRENLRLARSRVYGVVKRMARAFGRAYVEAGAIDRVDDVFFLTIDEMLDQAAGTSVSSDLRALVAMRRADHARFLAGPSPPSRVVVGGRREDSRATIFPGPGPRPGLGRGLPNGPGPGPGLGPRPGEDETSGTGQRMLRGTGCSKGVAVGAARVVLDPRADMRVAGEVLVARMTDPGWVFLMISAAAIVVEKGSLLSHTAIIGRELGVPTVVGLEDATSRIPDGARVRVDGRAGTVELLDVEG